MRTFHRKTHPWARMRTFHRNHITMVKAMYVHVGIISSPIEQYMIPTAISVPCILLSAIISCPPCPPPCQNRTMYPPLCHHLLPFVSSTMSESYHVSSSLPSSPALRVLQMSVPDSVTEEQTEVTHVAAYNYSPGTAL